MNSSAKPSGRSSSGSSTRSSDSPRTPVGIRHKLLDAARAALVALLVSFGCLCGMYTLVLYFAIVLGRILE